LFDDNKSGRKFSVITVIMTYRLVT
jgi:hypothetical protein